jgi:cell division protein FtsW (lipid II flippase)
MIKKIFNFFFSLEFALVLSLIFIVAMGSATLLKTDLQAWQYVYGTKWFELIMWLLGINLVGVMFRYKTYKKMPIFLLHLSIIVILLGAATVSYTHLTLPTIA